MTKEEYEDLLIKQKFAIGEAQIELWRAHENVKSAKQVYENSYAAYLKHDWTEDKKYDLHDWDLKRN